MANSYGLFGFKFVSDAPDGRNFPGVMAVQLFANTLRKIHFFCSEPLTKLFKYLYLSASISLYELTNDAS